MSKFSFYIFFFVFSTSIAFADDFTTLGVRFVNSTYNLAIVAPAATILGLYYWLNPDGRTSVSSNGDLSRPTTESYVDLSLPVPAVVEKPVTTKMPFSKLSELAKKKNADGSYKYPNVEDAIEKSIIDDHASVTYSIGALFKGGPDGTVFKVTGPAVPSTLVTSRPCLGIGSSYTYGYTTESPVFPTFTFTGASDKRFWSQKANSTDTMGTICSQTIVPATAAEIAAAGKVAKPLADVRKALTGLSAPSPEDTPVTSSYQAELDKMFHDPDYVPVFTDDSTGLPNVPPSSSRVATPAQVQAHNDSGIANSNPAAASSGAVVSAGAAATAAGTAATAAAAAAAANPGNVDLANAANAAAANAAAAKAAYDRLLAEQAAENALTAPTLGGDNVYDSDITGLPEKKGIADLLGTFVSSSPLVSMVRSFTVTTSFASGVVPIGNIYGQELSFDFTRWEPTLRACGGVLIIIMHGFAVFVVIRGW